MSLKSHGNALPEGYQLLWYRIGHVLGQGGFGITYEAFDTNLEKPVAIKEYLPKEFAVREQDSSVRPFTEDRKQMFDWGLTRFLQEARTLAKFHHPNIILVHNVFEENGTAYMVMEFEQGEALDKLFKFGRIESEKDLLRILHPLLDGVEHMHEAGFIHRDIKPANIYIRQDGSPVLLDFGSARFAIGGETRALTSIVTPGFAPYEQYHNESGKQGPWTDIYGLGATLYAGINRGRGPMDAIVRGNARIEGKSDPMESAIELGKGKYPEAFLHAIDSALGFTTEERPQTVAAWRALFSAPDEPPSISKTSPLSEADIPTVIHGGTPTPMVPTSPPRHFSILMVVVLTLIVVGIASGIFWTQPWKDTTPAQSLVTDQQSQQEEIKQQKAEKEAEVKKQQEEQERLAAQIADERRKQEAERAREAEVKKARREQLEKKEAAAQLAKEKTTQERQNNINQLLMQATQDIAEGRLFNTDNKQDAMSRYKAILKLDSGNKYALDGIARLTEMMTTKRQPTAPLEKTLEGPLPIAIVTYGETPKKSADYVSDKLRLNFTFALKKLSINDEVDALISIVDRAFFITETRRGKSAELCKNNPVSMIFGIYFDHSMGGLSGELIVTSYDCSTKQLIKKPYGVEFDKYGSLWAESWREAIASFINDTGVFTKTKKKLSLTKERIKPVTETEKPASTQKQIGLAVIGHGSKIGKSGLGNEYVLDVMLDTVRTALKPEKYSILHTKTAGSSWYKETKRHDKYRTICNQYHANMIILGLVTRAAMGMTETILFSFDCQSQEELKDVSMGALGGLNKRVIKFFNKHLLLRAILLKGNS